MTPKQRKIESLIHDVWKQNPRIGNSSTYNPCEAPGCAMLARGTGLCQGCVVKELATLVGEPAALRYREAVTTVRALEWEMVNQGTLIQST